MNKNKTCLITGASGFVGGYLAKAALHAGYTSVHGTCFGDAENAMPGVPMELHELDILDSLGAAALIGEIRPGAIFHLAALSSPALSWKKSALALDINVKGALHILEAVRATGRPAAAVMVTTDKCYENFESVWGRRETDPLGGSDPYSASKAAAELVVAAYRQSYFPVDKLREHRIRTATARGGNVIGGGDWAAERLLPDLARAALAGRAAVVRNPQSVRPWQHVLDCLAGYVVLAERLLIEPENPEWCSAWNFGPEAGDVWTVARLAETFCSAWGRQARWREESDPAAPLETGFLSLCIDKATRRLGWRPRWNTARAVAATAAWYSASSQPGFEAAAACDRDICDYMEIV